MRSMAIVLFIAGLAFLIVAAEALVRGRRAWRPRSPACPCSSPVT
jgi:hypothetical protein